MNKKGFTLAELLIVVAFLGIIALVVVPNMSSMNKKMTTEKANSYLSDIALATEAYIQKHIDEYRDIKYKKSTVYVYFSELIKEGYLKSTTVDPATNTQVKDLDYTVAAYLNDDNQYTYVVLDYHLKSFQKYLNGEAIYFNPETNKTCDVAAYNANIQTFNGGAMTEKVTGLKTGCMKWYAFNDDRLNATVTMILDHNTTPLVAWNSTNSNATMGEVKTALDSDTSTWKSALNARLITADEVAKITGHPTFNSASTQQPYWFFFDTNDQSRGELVEPGYSNYAWLYDYTCDARNHGANIDDNDLYDGRHNYGYWTSTPALGSTSIVWVVDFWGNINSSYHAGDAVNKGVRPVIEVDKQLLR